jgi:hypothetical protein
VSILKEALADQAYQKIRRLIATGHAAIDRSVIFTAVPRLKGSLFFCSANRRSWPKRHLLRRGDLVAVGEKRTWIARGLADGHPLRRVGRFALSSIEL